MVETGEEKVKVGKVPSCRRIVEVGMLGLKFFLRLFS